MKEYDFALSIYSDDQADQLEFVAKFTYMCLAFTFSAFVHFICRIQFFTCLLRPLFGPEVFVLTSEALLCLYSR